jgi:hypothetical protein
MRSMSILEEMLEIFATTVQAELNATLHVCESGIFLGLVPKESPCITMHGQQNFTFKSGLRNLVPTDACDGILLQIISQNYSLLS